MNILDIKVVQNGFHLEATVHEIMPKRHILAREGTEMALVWDLGKLVVPFGLD
jgi:hypothetical protein